MNKNLAASNIVNYGPACTMKRKPLPEEYLRFLDDPTSKGAFLCYLFI
jgi:hypothetical protein